MQSVFDLWRLQYVQRSAKGVDVMVIYSLHQWWKGLVCIISIFNCRLRLLSFKTHRCICNFTNFVAPFSFVQMLTHGLMVQFLHGSHALRPSRVYSNIFDTVIQPSWRSLIQTSTKTYIFAMGRLLASRCTEDWKIHAFKITNILCHTVPMSCSPESAGIL